MPDLSQLLAEALQAAKGLPEAPQEPGREVFVKELRAACRRAGGRLVTALARAEWARMTKKEQLPYLLMARLEPRPEPRLDS